MAFYAIFLCYIIDDWFWKKLLITCLTVSIKTNTIIRLLRPLKCCGNLLKRNPDNERGLIWQVCLNWFKFERLDKD